MLRCESCPDDNNCLIQLQGWINYIKSFDLGLQLMPGLLTLSKPCLSTMEWSNMMTVELWRWADYIGNNSYMCFNRMISICCCDSISRLRLWIYLWIIWNATNKNCGWILWIQRCVKSLMLSMLRPIHMWFVSKSNFEWITIVTMWVVF